MGNLSKLSEKCTKCPYVDNCKDKRMETCAYMDNLEKELYGQLYDCLRIAT